MPPWTARGLLGRLKRRFSAARPGGLPFAPTEKQKRIPLLAAPENTADENCKIRTHAFLDMGAFACILYDVLTQEIHRQNLKRHRFSPHVLDNL